MENKDLNILTKEQLIKEIIDLKGSINFLSQEIAQLKRMIFGQKRERFIPDVDQLELFGDKPNQEVETEDVNYTRKKQIKKQTPHSRNPIPSNLPRKEIIIEPEGVDTASMTKIGEERTEELEYEEAKLYVKVYVRPKYVSKIDEKIVIAEMPDRIIPKGIAGPGLIAHFIGSKFLDHLPIYRIIKDLKRKGVGIAESSANDWIKSAVGLIKPLYELQKRKILEKDYLMVDETTIRVLDIAKKGKAHKGYFWVYYDPVNKEVFFEYQKGRSSKFPTETLADFSGSIQTDGYAGYNEVGRREDVTLLACFAHARRKFENALVNDKKRAVWMLGKIRELYLIERDAKESNLNFKERYELRQRHSIEILDEMYQWLKDNQYLVLPKSGIGKAINYTMNLWSRLIRYVNDGHYEIDNNFVENKIRPIAIGRKNYLFAGSHNGAEWAAILYTLLANAELKGLEPKSYLKELLTKIASHPINRLDELLPENFVKLNKDNNVD
jgi:transposase